MASLWAVVGATGTGKSAFALDLAERLIRGGEPAAIVNADAMQLYRGMDIGTAKLSLEERRGIPHFQLDVLEVTDEASVAAFQREARRDIDALLESGTHAILVGGSGLYVSSVLFGFRFPGTDSQIRAELEAELEALGAGALHQRLAGIDAKTAADIGPHNGRRLVRALEVIAITGEPSAARLPETPEWWRPTHVTRLDCPRLELVARLDARVEAMWRAGLVDEVEDLLERGLDEGVTARKAIGYAQARAQLRGELSELEAIAETQRLTRTYARRQVNWFSRIPSTPPA
ncbi:MAG TPA: tRNA (adenosine(37)-N6)-dimethylallyltransferase MiaA [Microbacteriaceae bacterium]|nr:tRNA (adenosine(37)-N6)-dimethylallyltransferase MiaA [Microbacteriaceae bacterium]